MLASLRGVLAHGLSLAQVRLELLAVEVEEERNRLGTLLAYGLMAFFFLGFGALALAVWLTVVWWDTHRLLPLAVLTALFLGLGVGCAVACWRAVTRGSRLFASSLAELALDRDALRGDR